MARILVINPNSSAVVTAAMDRALDPLRAADGPEIVALPIAMVRPASKVRPTPIWRRCKRRRWSPRPCRRRRCPRRRRCLCDRVLFRPRSGGGAKPRDKPVFGIAECGVLAALGHGAAVGVIAILSTSVARHWRYFPSLGLDHRIAGDRPIEMGVAALSDADATCRRLIEVGTCLRDVDGAGALVLGCAGMAAYRGAVERAVGLPVIDPTQAAVAMAATSLRLRAAG